MNTRFCLPTALLLFSGLLGTARSAHAQYTELALLPPPCAFPTGIIALDTRNELHVYCAFSDDIHVLDLAGDSLAAYYTGFSDDGFRHTGMIADTAGHFLMLRDLRPPRLGPGAELWSMNPASRTGQFLLDLVPVTGGEPYGLTLHPGNGNLLLGESFRGPGHVIEITRTGTLVDTVLTMADIDALGIDVDAGDIQIYPPTGELVIGGWSGPNVGKLYAIDLDTGTAREFFDTGITAAETGPTGITFCANGDMALVTPIDFRLYDLDGDGALCGPGTGTLVEQAQRILPGFRLTPSYPNPFRRTTRFNLRVDRPQPVHVSVHDVLGRHMATLYHGPVAPGTPMPLSVRADGWPGGIYIIRVTGADFTAARPIIHIQE